MTVDQYTDRDLAIAKAATSTANIWTGIITRCYNPKCDHYKHYGARGIGMCNGWRMDKWKFVKDMGIRPSPLHSVDRIENSLGYWCGNCEECKSLGRRMNCRWEVSENQCNNRRSSRFLEFDGQRRTVAQWQKKMGFPDHLIRKRLQSGWTVEEAISTPAKESCKIVSWNGKSQSISDWSRECGIPVNALIKRLLRKGSMEEAMGVDPPRKRNLGYEADGETHTLREWERISGVPYQTIYSRIRSGMTLKEAMK